MDDRGENVPMMAYKKAEGVQRPHTSAQQALLRIIVVTNLLSFQVVFTPSALATSVAPPSGISASTPNVTTQQPSTEGGALVNGGTTGGIAGTTKHETNSVPSSSGFVASSSTSSGTVAMTESSATNPFSLNITNTGLADNTSTSVQQSTVPTSENDTTGPNGTPQPDLSTQLQWIRTTKSFTDPTTTLNVTATTAGQTSVVTRTLLTTVPQATSVTERQSETSIPTVTTGIGTAFTSTPTIPTDTPTIPTDTPTIPTDTPTIPTDTPQPTSETATPTSALLSSLKPSRSFSTRMPELTSNNVRSTLSTDIFYETTVGSALTTDQWIGIGVSIGIFLALLVIVICLLVWRRTRRKSLSKKPSIRVSREEYSKSSTLALKDPQWRKSLTMALQSMNTHIELPKETEEEMQAVDNSAYDDESHDPQPSNQDPSHLTKV